MEWFTALLNWYQASARDLPWRRTNDPYAIWVSEIMLQQTRVAAVVGYYERFMTALPDVFALADAPLERVYKLWEGLGYYSRAAHLKRAAEYVVRECGGVLPDNYQALLALPGVGEYTAGAIASIAYGEAVPAVDGNVLRVYARVFADERDVRDPATKRDVRAYFLSNIPSGQPGAFNAALMELGACICLPNGAPACGACPISKACRAYAEGRVFDFPVVSKKKPRRVEEKTVFALETDTGAFWGMIRPETGLLAGLYQLPETEGILDDNACAAWLMQRGIIPQGELVFYTRKHIFTHVEWRMRVLHARVYCRVAPEGWTLLSNEHALPTAYRVCLPTSRAKNAGT